jgi:L-ribulose-5-phosphate 3-epimerase
MRLGYNTNGLAHHRLLDAIEVLADEGYASVAITLDAGALDPYEEPVTLARQVHQVRSALDRHGLARVIETGARYLLNPRLKHDPTLMDPDPARRDLRVDFLRRSIDLASALGAEAVSFWSGKSPLPVDEAEGMERLIAALQPVLHHAERMNMPLAFEPEPGMFIDTLDRFARLDERVRHPLFDLTIDVGHVHCSREGDIAGRLRAWRSRLRNLHIEDMVEGVHEHLMFGEGTMDFPPIVRALHAIAYRGGVHVELSRHSHVAVEAVRASAAFLKPLLSAPLE